MAMPRMAAVVGVLVAVGGVARVAAIPCSGNQATFVGTLASSGATVTCSDLTPGSSNCSAVGRVVGGAAYASDVCPQCGICTVTTFPPSPSTSNTGTCVGDNTCTARVQSWRSTTTCAGPSNVTNLGNCQSFYDPDTFSTVWTLVYGGVNGTHFCVFTSAAACNAGRAQTDCNGYQQGQCIPFGTVVGSCEQNDDDDQTADDGNGPGSNIVTVTCNGQATRAPTTTGVPAPTTFSPNSLAPTIVRSPTQRPISMTAAPSAWPSTSSPTTRAPRFGSPTMRFTFPPFTSNSVPPSAPTTFNFPTFPPYTQAPIATAMSGSSGSGPCVGDNTCTARVQAWRASTICDGPSAFTDLGNCQSFDDPDTRTTFWTLVYGGTSGAHFCVFSSAASCNAARSLTDCNGYPRGQCVPIRTLGSCEENDEDDQEVDDGNGPGSNIVILTCNGQTVPTTRAPTSNAPITHSPTSFAPTTRSPTTVAPTSRPPYWNLNQPGGVTTYAPVTVAPTMLAPTSIAPTTVAPTTHAPTRTLGSTAGSSSSSSGPSAGVIAGAVIGAVVGIAVVAVVVMKLQSGRAPASATAKHTTFNNPCNQEFDEVDEDGSVQASGQSVSEYEDATEA